MKQISRNEQGFTHYLLLFVMVLLVVGFAYIGAKRIISSHADTLGDFGYVATHPQAATQPTAMGKTIIALKPFNGKIYAGYGDYGANTGPISVTPFDPTTNAFSASPLISFATEQIAVYRIINSKLYAPAIDPSALSTSAYYASGDASGAWTQRLIGQANGPVLDHVYDINTLNGTDLYVAGSKDNDAVVYRSTDGGATWTKSLDLAVAGRVERFYAIGSFNGKLYVVGSSFDVAQTTSYVVEPNSHVFDGTTWSTGPSLGTTINYFWHPETFANKMLYLSYCNCNAPAQGLLRSLDTQGNVQVYSLPSNIFDFTIDGNTLYVLGSDGNVYSSTDLSSWYKQRGGVTTARSITVLNGQIYLGTTDSKIYKASVNPSPTLATGTTITVTGGTTSKSHGSTGGGGHKK